MMFQEEHHLASEYFSSMDSNLCFDPLVGTERVWYFVSFKRDDVNLNGDKEKKTDKLFNEYNFASDYDFELVIFSKRSLTSVINKFQALFLKNVFNCIFNF